MYPIVNNLKFLLSMNSFFCKSVITIGDTFFAKSDKIF